MKQERQRMDVLSLLQGALRGAAEVDLEEDGSVRVTPRHGEPVRLDVKLLAQERREPSDDPEALWVIRGASERRLERLRDEGRSFVELSRGLVCLNAPGLLVDRRVLDAVARSRRSSPTRNPFSDRASLVSRVLFETGEEREWTVMSLACQAGVAASTVSYVVRALDGEGLVDVRREWRERKIRLLDRARLIDVWTREYTWRSNEAWAFHAPLGSPSRFLRRLPELLSGVAWALTLHSGASLVAPHARWERVHIYVDTRGSEGAEALGRRLNWTPADEGAVVLLEPYYRTSIWPGVREAQGLPVVSDLQLILDLWEHPLRGREQGEVLLEKVRGAGNANA